MPPWKKGESGNKNGSSRKARFTRLLRKRIRELGAEQAIIDTWLAMVMGDKKALKGRDPSYVFFREMLDRIEGPVKLTDPLEERQPTPPPPGIRFPALKARINGGIGSGGKGNGNGKDNGSSNDNEGGNGDRSHGEG